MKILIATGIFLPDIGGPATYSKLLANELPMRGIEVSVLSFSAVRKFSKLIRHFIYFLKVLKSGRKTDIIFAQDPVSVGLPSCLVAKILRKKFVLKIVGDYAWEQGMQRFGVKDLLDDFLDKKYCWQVEILRKIQKFVAKSANKIIVPGEYLKKVILRWKIEERKIKVIYNAFDTFEIKISKDEARKKLDLNGFILISAGRMVMWKGFDVLIEIMSEILKGIPEAKMIIIGDGSERKNLELRIENLRLEGTIILIGQISREQVINYLKAGDLFILNTGYEGLSHQILEAMAVGIPVITTNVGGNPELINHGENGFLVEYNNKKELVNAITGLCMNESLRNKFIEKSKEKIHGFTKEKMITETIKFLNEI